MRASTYDEIVLWVATLGQLLFIGLWATQRWWGTNVGQALMAKSAALAAILAASLFAYYYGPLPMWVGRLLFTAIAVGIVWQVVVMSYEIWRDHRGRSR